MNSQVSKIYYDHIKVGDDVCEINEEYIEGEQVELIYDWVENHFPTINTCPFCSTPLLSANFEEIKYDPESRKLVKKDIDNTDPEIKYLANLTLWSCDYCAYWQWYWHGATTWFLTEVYSEAYISKLKEFDDKLPEDSKSELAQLIRRNQRIWHTIDPYKLEKLVSDVFKANYSKCEVFHVGRPHDRGVDVLFIDSNKQQWLVQVKRRGKSSASEGVQTIQNLLGVMDLKDSRKGILVSTADHFTYRAYEAVGLAKKIGKIIQLIDRGKLNRMLGPILPDRPWRSIIKEKASISLLNYFSRRIPKNPRRSKKI